ncbi:MAG: hypothetical protein HYX90_11525 [Chloroflexi bacterium]|nr:hypothetical protein [Chloroflexota bacterium]
MTITPTRTRMNPIVQQLKDQIVIKSFRSTLKTTPEGYEKEDISNAFRPGVKLSLERARLYTESYKASEGEATIVRRAKALANILEKMTLYIEKGQRIVGNYAETPSHLTWHPEYSYRWLLKAMDEGYGALLDDAGKEELAKIASYWKGKSVQGSERDYLSADLKAAWSYNGATMFTHQTESGVPDYEMVFKVGLNGLIRKAEEKLAALLKDPSVPAKDFVEQKQFLEAVIISLKAAVNWSKRYADLARRQADSETGWWKQRLLEIADACDNVPANPPRSLYEAVEAFWQLDLITHLIEAYENGISARMDQVFYPYYKKDLEEGRITREQATELFEYLWIKCEGMGFLFAPVAGGGASQGSGLQQTLALAGITPEGRDSVNELTYVILDSCDDLAMSEPTTAIRIHEGTSREFLLRVIDSIRKRPGTVSLFNDEVIIPKLLEWGIPLRDARNYGVEQCMRWTIPGKNIVYRSIDGRIGAPKCLELALNQGLDPVSGKQLGAKTPDPLTFSAAEDVFQAFLTQVRFFAEKLARIGNVVDALYEEHLPRPFLSAVIDGGIEAGKDCRKWYYFPKRSMGLLGPVNIADALAAIQKLVFEEKRVPMKGLLDALKKNWEGSEDLRLLIINGAPKYGNDDDYVDSWARRVHVSCERIVEDQKNYYGSSYRIDGSSVASYYAYSTLTGATPEGRKAFDLYYDGSVSPGLDRDRKGPTAVLKSASKADPWAGYNYLLNQRFFPDLLEGHNKEAFAAYLKTWHDLGIHHIQFNIVDTNMLLDAQKHPEKYQHLVVRVAGYSAYFVDLSRGLQNQIIRRTLHPGL